MQRLGSVSYTHLDVYKRQVDSSPMCGEIYSQMIENKCFILSDIDNIVPNELPEADIITAKLLTGSFKHVNNKKSDTNENDAVFKIISERLPKVFIFEVPSRMITGCLLYTSIHYFLMKGVCLYVAEDFTCLG